MDDKTKYLLSLPERTLRSVTSVVTGITSMSSQLLLPKSFRKSATYRVTFGMLQQFMMESVAEVTLDEKNKEIEVKEEYAKRKAVGSMIEGASLLGFHFSPVWLLAIVSDLAGGSKTYLNQLVDDFKAHKIIDSDREIENVSQLLDGISQSTKLGMDAIDTPPITADTFEAFKASTKEQLGENSEQLKMILGDLEDIYRQMLAASKDADVDMKKLSGSMALNLMASTAQKGIDLTKVSSKTTLEFFREHVIGSYQESLNDLNEAGKLNYIKTHMAPFLETIPKHFAFDKETTTSWLLDKRTGEK